MKKYAPFITNTFLIVALFLLAFYNFHSLSAWKNYRAIQQKGIPIEALIVKKNVNRNSKGADYHHVEITYSVVGSSFTKEILVTPEIYSRLHEGSPARAYYLEGNPDHIDFRGNTSFAGTLWMILLLDGVVLIFGLCIIGIQSSTLKECVGEA